jgi:hypothetical protein
MAEEIDLPAPLPDLPMRPDEQRALLRSLGILPEDEGVADDAATAPADAEVDFDGGPRESAPLPSDPVGDHDETVLEIIQKTKWGSL